MKDFHCTRCGVVTATDAHYCQNCGRKLGTERSFSLSRLSILAVVFGAASLWLTGTSMQSALSGVKPTAAYRAETEQYEDPSLQRLRDAIAAEPGKIELRAALAEKLEEIVTKEKDPRSPLAAELIDALAELSRLSPKDETLRLKLADVSFDLFAFKKSAEYYEAYLKSHPQDTAVRGRYASALIFLNRYEDALRELKRVLKTDPNNFHAHAYLAISYAQTGKVTLAREEGKRALKLAPNEEARERFSRFLSSLAETSETGDPLVNYIRANPVAGPKFEKADPLTQGSLTLYFRDFPMSAMPPQAKEKFFSGIRDRVHADKRKDLKTIVFADAASGAVLDRLALQ